MANPDAPFGFRPYKNIGGGTPGRLNEYTLSTAYNTSLFKGDLVKTDGSGNVVIAAAGDQAVGVFWGVRYVATDGSVVYKNSWTGSTSEQSGSIIRALVHDDPNTLFLAQSDGTMTAADIGLFCDINTTQSGNTLTGWSRQQTSTTASTESQFKIVDVIGPRHQIPCRNDVGNQDFYATGLNALVVVKLIKHENGSTAVAEV